MVVKFYILHLTQCRLLTPHFFRLSMCVYPRWNDALALKKSKNQQENSRMFHKTWSSKKIIKDVQVRLVCQYWSSQRLTKDPPETCWKPTAAGFQIFFLQIKQISGIFSPKLTLQLNSTADLFFSKEGSRL